MKNMLPVSRFETFSFFFLVGIIAVVGQSVAFAVNMAGSAAWIAMAAAGGLSVVLLWLSVAFLRSVGERPLLSAAEIALGHKAAIVFKSVVLIYMFFFVAATLHQCTKVLTLYNLKNSGTALTSGLMLFGAFFAASFSFKGFMRLCGILLPVIAGFLILLFCLSYRRYEPNFLFPVLGHGITAIGKTGFFSLSNMILFWPVLIFLDDFETLTAMRRPALLGQGAAAIFLTAATALVSMTISHHASVGSTSLLFDLTRAINVSHLLQNIEPLFITVAGFGLIVQMALGLHALRRVGADLFKLSQERQPVFLRISAGIIFCLVFLQNNFTISNDVFSQTMRHYAFIFAASLFMILFSFVRLRKIGQRKLQKALGLILCLVLVCATLSGCKTYNDIDEILYPTSIGIDRGGQKLYQISFKLLDTANKADPDHAAEDKSPQNLFTVDADNGEDAMNAIYAKMPMRLSMSHIQMVIISDELKPRDIGELIYQLYHRQQLKNSAAIMVCKGKAAFAMQAKMPEIFGPVEQLAGVSAYSDNNYPLTTISDFINLYNSPYGDPLLGYIGHEGNPDKSPVVPLGSYLFCGGESFCILTREETRLLHMLRGTFEESAVTVSDPINPGGFISVMLESGGKPRTSVTAGHSPAASISVFLSGWPGASQNHKTDYTLRTNTDLLRKHTEAFLKNEMETLVKKLRACQSDAVRLGMYAARHFATIEDFEKYEFRRKYKAARIDISVRLDM